MVVPPSLHRIIRRLTGWYPFRTPSYELNKLLGWLGFDDAAPLWMATRPRGDVPGIALNVADRYHRKHYYFLKAYWRQACAQPLGGLLEETLTPGGTFLDIGAHLGFYALLASRLVGDGGAVHAFDPDPMTVESLRRSAAINGGRVKVHGIALADAPGELPLYRASAQAHSLVPAAGADPRYTGEAFTVPVKTLDAWAEEVGLEPRRIQVIKIDVEGVEARTVAGGLGLLERAGRPLVWCEVRGPQGSTRAPDTFVDVLAHLAPLGYRPYRWRPGALEPVEPSTVLRREDILFRAGPTP